MEILLASFSPSSLAEACEISSVQIEHVTQITIYQIRYP